MIMGILSFFSNLLSLISFWWGESVILVQEKVVDYGKEKDALHNVPHLRWAGIALFSRYNYSVAQKKAKELSGKIRDDKKGCPDLIVGIGRGGAIFGSMLSYRLGNTPLLIVDRTYYWSSTTNLREEGILFDFNFPRRFKDNVLVVAGEYHSGKTMSNYCTYLNGIGVKEIRTCSFFVEKGTGAPPVDFCGVEAQGCPLMPWQDAGTIRDSISSADSRSLMKMNAQHRKRIFIVRHGETFENANDVFIGNLDVDLSGRGKVQASKAGALIGKNMIPETMTTVLFSTKRRCRDTANLIWDQLQTSDIELVSCPWLLERNYGAWEGMSRADIDFHYHDLYQAYQNDPLNCTPPGADSLQSVIDKANLISEALKGIRGQNVILVTHKTTGRVILSLLLGRPVEDYRVIPFLNGQVVILDCINGVYTEVEPDDVS